MRIFFIENLQNFVLELSSYTDLHQLWGSFLVWSDPAPVLLSNELNFARLARLELDQCLLNWPRPAGLSRNFRLLDPTPRSCRSPNCRMRWILNRCISELCPVSFQNCKDPRLTFHKDLGGGAHTHPTVLVTKINCVSKEVSGHVSKVILRWFLLWKMFRILKLGPKAIAQQTTTFKSPYNNPLLHCAVFLIGWPR